MASTAPPKYPPKRIITCCDGTWQSANHGTRSVPSNVAKLSRAISVNGKTEDGGWCPQVVWYDSGVGTGTGSLGNQYAGAFGEGLSENVCEGYNFIVNNYSPGDELYFFGFSRGAFTARSIAGLVADVGICTNAMMDQFWEMWEAYAHRGSTKMKDTDWGQGRVPSYAKDKGKKWAGKGHGDEWLRKCQQDFVIQVVGVFDTVGSLGWPNTKLFNISWKNADEKYGFHDTDIHPVVKYAFHALAIDERRQPFAPTLWNLPPDSKTRLIQCWFPGFHINIGGGQNDGLKDVIDQKGDLESMANITFAWMVDRVRESTHLAFDDAAIDDILERYINGLEQLIQREVSSDKEVYRGWGVGPIRDSYSAQGWVAQGVSGEHVRTPGQYRPDKLPDGREDPKRKGADLHASSQEYIHPVVAHAIDPAIKRDKTYDPVALKGFERKMHPGNGWFWRKEVPPSDPSWFSASYIRGMFSPCPKGQPQVVLVPEFVIPPEAEFAFPSLERKLILAEPRALAAGASEKAQESRECQCEDAKQAAEFLKRLDKENGTDRFREGRCPCWKCLTVEERFGGLSV